MAHSDEDVRKIAELNAAFVTLNDKGKDSALTILRTLRFAQAVMGTGTYEAATNTGGQQTARVRNPYN